MAKVVAVNISDRKGVQKKDIGKGNFIEQYGLEGDAHAGKRHRQVSFLAVESVQKMKELGLDNAENGMFAENITTEGIELFSLPVGTKLEIGEALFQVTQIGKECHQKCAIYYKVGNCAMPLEGIFARVLRGGVVKAGDEIIIKNDICGYSFEEFLNKISEFHGSIAPGLVLGGYMVEMAKSAFEDERSFYAFSESNQCLPDAIQLLTPCTIGNKRLKVLDLGRYAIVFYDKNEGTGVRVSIDTEKLEKWPIIKEWYFKTRPKEEQDLDALLDAMKNAGLSIFSIKKVKVGKEYLGKKKMGKTGICPICNEAYPLSHGSVCRGCAEILPYKELKAPEVYDATNRFGLVKTPVEDAVGKHLLHDVTKVEPNKSKGPAFRRGHLIKEEDIPEFKSIGKFNLYLKENNTHIEEFIHEEEAALAIAEKMVGQGVDFDKKASEGKVNLVAGEDGLLVINENGLKRFNMNKGVICAARKNYSLVKKGDSIAGTRIIPLCISKNDLLKILSVMDSGPIFSVRPLRSAKVGILSTGTEVYEKIVEERYSAIMAEKVEKLGCSVVAKAVAPDSAEKISEGIGKLIEAGADMVICTSGMSVDPDDVTVDGIISAGAENVRYGVPVLPGSMLLLADIGNTQIIGAPACGLHDPYFSIDLVLPRLLAGIDVTEEDLAELGIGGLLKA